MTFAPYMDRFNASAWPEDVRERLAINALSLHGELDRLNLRPLIGCDLHRIRDHQEKHSGHMEVLSPPFDPGRHGSGTENNSCVVAIEDAHGNGVAICGARLFWIEESLTESIPAQILPGSIVNAPTAERVVSCSIVWSGAAHVVNGQSRDVFPIMSRLLHLAIFTHWKFSWRVGIAKESVARAYGNKTYGFPMIEQGLWRGDKEDWLMLAPRKVDALRMPSPTYADLAKPLGTPMTLTGGPR